MREFLKDAAAVSDLLSDENVVDALSLHYIPACAKMASRAATDPQFLRCALFSAGIADDYYVVNNDESSGNYIDSYVVCVPRGMDVNFSFPADNFACLVPDTQKKE